MAKTTRTVRIQFFSEYLLGNKISRCKKCPRLAGFLAEHREKNPDWYCKPVPGFGDPNAKIVLLGLAPGLKGANRTGRPFTGDAAGIWLYRILYQRGFCNNEESISGDDNTALRNIYIANVVKCRPPKNRDPRQDEIDTCKPFLRRQIELVDPSVVITLGNFSSKLLMPTTTGITRLRGKAYEWWGRYLVPTFHPAAALRGGESVKNDIRADLGIVRSLLEGRVTSDSQEAPNPTISVEPIQVASEEQLGLFGTASS